MHRVPCAQEDDVAHEDLIFEGSAEMALGFRQRFFDLPADAGHGADGGALEFGDFERGGEHVPDESRVAEDFVGRAGQF